MEDEICSTIGCGNLAVRSVNETYYCMECGEKIKKNKEKKKSTSTHNIKGEDIIDTYINLAEAIHEAGGSITVLNRYKNKRLSEFLEEVCAPNGIRFIHKKR